MSRSCSFSCLVGYNSRRTSGMSDKEKLGAELCDSTMQLGDDSVFVPADNEEACLLAEGLCRDYVCYRLKRSGYERQVHMTHLKPANDHALSNRILNLGCDFEKFFPKVYASVYKNVGTRCLSEESLRRLFYRLGTHIMGGHQHCYTWGRLLALFCVAGAMAVDCVTQGHPELVESVIKVSSEYMKHTLVDWVVLNGGWANLAKHFTPDRTCRDKIRYEFTIVPSKYILPILSTTAVTILGFIFMRDCENFFF